MHLGVGQVLPDADAVPDLIRRSHRQNAAARWKPLVASSAIRAAATALMCASLDSAGRAGE